jgi:hypothetical protein
MYGVEALEIHLEYPMIVVLRLPENDSIELIQKGGKALPTVYGEAK